MRWFKAAGIAVLLALVAMGGLWLRGHAFGLVRISGTSMSDTLRNGDVVLVTRFDYRDQLPALGDVVACRFPGREDVYIKRVAGLPGMGVEIRSGRLRLDGFPVEEPYVSSEAEDYETALGDDQYLLLGDNRAESYDSRMPDMGPVGADAIVGRVRFIVWPLNRLGGVD